MLKKPIIIALSLAAGVASATCDFPYYPEFANVFCAYDEVTPLMALKKVVYSPMYDSSGDVACEPLLIKDVRGMPLCYMVATYRGEDLDIARRWNTLVNKLNQGDRIPAEEINDEIEYFKRKDIVKFFGTQTILTYTFLCDRYCASNKNIPFALAYFPKAYKEAVTNLANGNIYLNRIIGQSYDYYHTFEFVDDEGTNIFIRINPQNEEAEEVSLEAIEADALGLVEYYIDGVRKKPDFVRACEESWLNVDMGVPDTEVDKELPVIRGPSGDSRDGSGYDTEREVLPEVPDVDTSVSCFICWANAIAAVYVYHSQHHKYLTFYDWKEPIPSFEDDWGWSSQTQQYIKAIATAYH